MIRSIILIRFVSFYCSSYSVIYFIINGGFLESQRIALGLPTINI